MEDNHAADAADDLSLFCCQNKRCPALGRRGAGNLCVRERIGKHKNIRLLYCRICKKRFSENKGTIFYRTRLPKQKIVAIMRHVQEGNGMRQTGRLEGVKEDTVIRLTRQAGRHARGLHEQLLAFSPQEPGTATG